MACTSRLLAGAALAACLVAALAQSGSSPGFTLGNSDSTTADMHFPKGSMGLTAPQVIADGVTETGQQSLSSNTYLAYLEFVRLCML